jgi:hypothetical protein
LQKQKKKEKTFSKPKFTFIDRKKGLTHAVIGICPGKNIFEP